MTPMPWEPNKLERERLDKLTRLQARGVDPFPPRVERTHTTAQAIAAFEAAEGAALSAPAEVKVTVCGR
jgi:lysyl-tRNA synthetase class 2